MILDCHYHLDTTLQSLDNLLLKMDANGIQKTVLMPKLCGHLPHIPEYQLKSLRFLLTHRSTRRLGEKLCAKFTEEGNLNLPSGKVRIYQDPDNTEVAKTIELHPDRFLGWIFVNPRGQNNPVEEFNKWKDSKNFIGVKAHPFWHQYPPEELLQVAELAAAHNMPLLIHVGFNDHGHFLPLVEEIPGLKLILAHAGFPGYKETWKIIGKQKNIWVDLSADAYVNSNTSRNVVEALGVERCVYGSDGPYGGVDDDQLFDNGKIKRRLENLFPNEKTRRMLLGDNFNQIIA